MSAVADLRALADRTNRELDAVHDFSDHSLIVWQSFRNHVAAGYKVTSVNGATGTTVDQEGLLELASHYAVEYLAAFTFRQFVSIFEVFLFDFLRLLFLQNPRRFGRKQLELSTVIDAKDREEVIASVIDKGLNELKYKPLPEWFTALDEVIHPGCPTPDEIVTLSEIKATRDILEHNAGVVNATYLRKAGTKARYRDGDRIEIDNTYHLESWRLIKKVAADLVNTTIARLSPVGGGPSP